MAIYICKKCTGPLKQENRFFSQRYICENCQQEYYPVQASINPLKLILQIALIALCGAFLSYIKTFLQAQYPDYNTIIGAAIGVCFVAVFYFTRSEYKIIGFTPVENIPNPFTRQDSKIVLTILTVVGILLLVLWQF